MPRVAPLKPVGDGELNNKTRRTLPPHTPFYLLFGYHGGGVLAGESNDGVVSIASQLRPEAQLEAARIYGLDADHTAILRDPLTQERFNAILAEVAGG